MCLAGAAAVAKNLFVAEAAVNDFNVGGAEPAALIIDVERAGAVETAQCADAVANPSEKDGEFGSCLSSVGLRNSMRRRSGAGPDGARLRETGSGATALNPPS